MSLKYNSVDFLLTTVLPVAAAACCRADLPIKTDRVRKCDWNI